MFVIFFALWIVFNGKVTTEIVILGLLVSAAIYAFVCKFMDFSPQAEIKILKKSHYIFLYIYHLIKEIVKANFVTMRFVTTSNYENEPVLIQFETKLKTEGARFMLANAITLTPGTITIDVEDNVFTVHCLDKTMAEGIEESIFVKLLEKIEE